MHKLIILFVLLLALAAIAIAGPSFALFGVALILGLPALGSLLGLPPLDATGADLRAFLSMAATSLAALATAAVTISPVELVLVVLPLVLHTEAKVLGSRLAAAGTAAAALLAAGVVGFLHDSAAAGGLAMLIAMVAALPIWLARGQLRAAVHLGAAHAS